AHHFAAAGAADPAAASHHSRLAAEDAEDAEIRPAHREGAALRWQCLDARDRSPGEPLQLVW
ncbi:MAG: hypothetical protein ACRDRH_24400, partial [Pseudonocardia sp.]